MWQYVIKQAFLKNQTNFATYHLAWTKSNLKHFEEKIALD
jgi:hypothetical protein